MIVRQLSDNDVTKKIIAMEGQFTISTINDVSEKLNFYLRKNKEIVLDMSKVSDIDCAGVQVLLYLMKIAEEDERNMKICKSNELIVDVMTMLNVNYLLV